MKIKTSDSFFPTKFRPVTANTNQEHSKLDTAHSRSYKLMKKRSTTIESNSNQNNQCQSANIFTNNIYANSEFNCQKDRPVGGIDMFMRQYNRKFKIANSRKLSTRAQSPEIKKKQILQQKNSSLTNTKIQQVEARKQNKYASNQLQVYKSHHSYTPATTIYAKKGTVEMKRTTSTGTKNFKNTNHDNWIEKQTQKYQTKMGILSQIYYKKPLVELYGDRYFQFLMRNRFQDQPVAPAFIHQVKSELQAKSIGQQKFIARLKKINSNLRNFEKLVLKGKKVTAEYCEDGGDF